MCGEKFRIENIGKRALIKRALYGRKSAGRDLHGWFINRSCDWTSVGKGLCGLFINRSCDCLLTRSESQTAIVDTWNWSNGINGKTVWQQSLSGDGVYKKLLGCQVFAFAVYRWKKSRNKLQTVGMKHNTKNVITRREKKNTYFL